MNAAAIRALELEAVFPILERYLSSDLGRSELGRVSQAPFHADAADAARGFALIGEAMDWLRASEDTDRRNLTPLPRFESLQDLHATADELEVVGSLLTAPQVADLLELLARAEETKQRLWRERAKRPKLADQADSIGEFAPVVRELAGKILPNHELSDIASSALSRIRRQIEQQRQTVHQSLERFVRKHFDEGVLQDNYATVRNGRSVVPVKSSWQGRIEGVVHSASSTGQTVFVEPLETITQNNKLVRLMEDEQREVIRILREMTERLREQTDEIRAAVNVLGRLELIFAKARFGRAFRCCLPRFEEGRFEIQWARHPLLQDVLARDGGKVQPLSLKLVDGSRCLIVSGPNAGGKTIVLKTVGLLALMAQAGLPVPAAEASLPWFEEVLPDIGDAQSIEASLSTFSAHIATLKHMLSAATSRSLVIIDELAGATDPAEGGAFAVAVVDRLLERGAYSLISTHLPALKVHAANSEQIVSAAMGFNHQTLEPNYELLLGVPGESAGLAMAERMGVDPQVIRNARAALAGQEHEASKYLASLRRQAEDYEARTRELAVAERRLEEKERELIRAMEEREKKKIGALEYRVAAAVREAHSKNEQVLADALAKLEAAQEAGKRQAVVARREALRTQREAVERVEQAGLEALGKTPVAEPAAPSDEIREGVRVRLAGFGTEGRVLRSLGSNRWEIQAGQLKMQVKAAQISEVLPDAQSSVGRRGLPEGVTLSRAEPDEQETYLGMTEINVIGQRTDEAEQTVEKFLDKAVLGEVNRLRIIHGHGTNALRRTLWKFFANHPYVDRHYQAESHEGGGGATIVELRADD